MELQLQVYFYIHVMYNLKNYACSILRFSQTGLHLCNPYHIIFIIFINIYHLNEKYEII